MKKYLILCIALALSLTACEKSALKQLPPATQEGKNTIGCIINGEVYNTWNEAGNSISCYRECKFYEGGLNGQYIASNTCDNKKKFGYVYIYIYDTLVEGKTYPFGEALDGNAVAEVSARFDNFKTDNSSSGTLTITKLTSNIISGIFSFTSKAHKPTSEDSTATITVTDGRFDLHR